MRHRPAPGQYHPVHYGLSVVGLALIGSMAWLAVTHQLKLPFVLGGGLSLTLLLLFVDRIVPYPRRALPKEEEPVFTPPAGEDFTPDEPELDEAPPVSWIAASVWRQRKQASRLGEFETDKATMAELEVTAEPPTAETRERVPTGPQPAVSFTAEAGTPEAAAAALGATPPVGVWWNPGPWPACCGQLAVLTLVNPTRKELIPYDRGGQIERATFDPEDDEVWRELVEFTRTGHEPENGMNLFQCPVCARLYGVATYD